MCINVVNRLPGIDSHNSLDFGCGVEETLRMRTFTPDQVHLRRIDPAQNMRRFYSLSLQPTLFGGASLIRDWGRIGRRGQTMMETFDTNTDAGSALHRLERSKRRRGYRDAAVQRR